MLKPRALRQGDRLAVVAPASPFDLQEFEHGLDEIRRLGFIPSYDDSIFTRRGYVAGSPAVRVAAIRSALRDPAIAGLIGARGGYGSAQLLPLLDREELRAARKPFIGYSDLTSLLTFLTTGCGLVAFHGPTVVGRLSRGSDGYDPDLFIRAVCCTEPIGELTAPGLETVHGGEADGVLLGGTLTQLVSSLATPFAFDPPAGYVLFLDEVRERPYRLDRMVTQLRQSGLLARAAAIVVGELPECDEPSARSSNESSAGPNAALTARAVMADLLADFPGPVLLGFPSGHTLGPATTLALGVACRVVTARTPRLVVDEAAVE